MLGAQTGLPSGRRQEGIAHKAAADECEWHKAALQHLLAGQPAQVARQVEGRGEWVSIRQLAQCMVEAAMAPMHYLRHRMAPACIQELCPKLLLAQAGNLPALVVWEGRGCKAAADQ